MSINLVCPVCGHRGKVVKETPICYTYFGVKCTHCDFAIPTNYRSPGNALAEWFNHCIALKKIKSKINSKRVIEWVAVFPEEEGHYIIAFHNNGGMFIRYIGILYERWSTCYGPIDYPEGTMYYGPLPTPSFVDQTENHQ